MRQFIHQPVEGNDLGIGFLAGGFRDAAWLGDLVLAVIPPTDAGTDDDVQWIKHVHPQGTIDALLVER
ncbi:hypothetical protein D3C81_1388550 [compost metagenome]